MWHLRDVAWQQEVNVIQHGSASFLMPRGLGVYGDTSGGAAARAAGQAVGEAYERAVPIFVLAAGTVGAAIAAMFNRDPKWIATGAAVGSSSILAANTLWIGGPLKFSRPSAWLLCGVPMLTGG
jgi:hypothetical protein